MSGSSAIRPLLYCSVIQNGGRTRLLVFRVFPDTSSSSLDSSLESSVLESEAEDSGKETADPECKSSDGQWRDSPKAKTNGKSKLASTKSLNTYCGRIISVGFFLTKRLRMTAFKERWKIALHFTSEEQLENFNLLTVGFCRKFATPVNQCYENNVPKDRKASLSEAWMKVLSDFQNGKATRE